MFLHSVWSTCLRGGVGGSTLVLCKTVNGFSLCERISVMESIADLPLSPCVPVSMRIEHATPAQHSDKVHVQTQTAAVASSVTGSGDAHSGHDVQVQDAPRQMSMKEELCALVSEYQSAAASADSGSDLHEEHDASTSAELIEMECNAQLLSQPFVVLHDVFVHDDTSAAGDVGDPGPKEELLLPLEAHLEDEPHVDDLFPQVHEDCVEHSGREVTPEHPGVRVRQKRSVSVVSPPPHSSGASVEVCRPSLQKRHDKSEPLPCPPSRTQKAPASVCEEDEDDVPLSVLHAKWATETTAAKRSANVKCSSSVKRATRSVQ